MLCYQRETLCLSPHCGIANIDDVRNFIHILCTLDSRSRFHARTIPHVSSPRASTQPRCRCLNYQEKLGPWNSNTKPCLIRLTPLLIATQRPRTTQDPTGEVQPLGQPSNASSKTSLWPGGFQAGTKYATIRVPSVRHAHRRTSCSQVRWLSATFPRGWIDFRDRRRRSRRELYSSMAVAQRVRSGKCG